MANENNLKKAAALIYFSLGLGIPNLVLTDKYNDAAPFGMTEVFGALIMLGLFVGLAYQIGQGKKWAAWTYTVFSVLGLLTIITIARAFEKNLLFGLVGLSQWGFQFYALYLIHESKLKSIIGLSHNVENNVSSPAKSNIIALKTSGEGTPKQQHGANSNTLNDIGKLHDLFKSGAITQDEFDQQKKKILRSVA